MREKSGTLWLLLFSFFLGFSLQNAYSNSSNLKRIKNDPLLCLGQGFTFYPTLNLWWKILAKVEGYPSDSLFTEDFVKSETKGTYDRLRWLLEQKRLKFLTIGTKIKYEECQKKSYPILAFAISIQENFEATETIRVYSNNIGCYLFVYRSFSGYPEPLTLWMRGEFSLVSTILGTSKHLPKVKEAVRTTCNKVLDQFSQDID